MAEEDVRERLAALEVEIGYLRKDVDRLAGSVERLTGLLDQAKGARLTVGLLLIVAGAVSTYLPRMIGLLLPKL